MVRAPEGAAAAEALFAEAASALEEETATGAARRFPRARARGAALALSARVRRSDLALPACA